MFKETKIKNMPGLSNQYVDALATLGSSLVFDKETTSVSVLKRNAPLMQTLFKKNYEINDKDWRNSILATLFAKAD